jgi:hypothetical protein
MRGAGETPGRRTDSVVVSEVADETVVYDLTRHKAHCLNPTAAFIWKACDGETTVAEIARRLGEQVGAAVGEDLVWRGLDHLDKARLLEGPIAFPGGRRMSRRDLLRKSSLAAGLIPIVASLVVPTPAIAANTCTPPNCVASNACRGAIDLCKCCGPPQCVKKCDANGNCSNAQAGC